MKIHRQIPIKVWVDVDEKIADLVLHLNTIKGVRTLASCQGTIGEGGAKPYKPYVMISWNNKKLLEKLKKKYKIKKLGSNYGYLFLTPTHN